MPDWLSEKRQKLYYVLDREVKKEGGSSLSIYALSSSADTGGGHGRTRGRSSASHARLLSLSLSLSLRIPLGGRSCRPSFAVTAAAPETTSEKVTLLRLRQSTLLFAAIPDFPSLNLSVRRSKMCCKSTVLAPLNIKNEKCPQNLALMASSPRLAPSGKMRKQLGHIRPRT